MPPSIVAACLVDFTLSNKGPLQGSGLERYLPCISAVFLAHYTLNKVFFQLDRSGFLWFDDAQVSSSYDMVEKRYDPSRARPIAMMDELQYLENLKFCTS